MKLGKLLFAGKSVIGGSKPVEYRANKLVSLPNFGPGKNPFTPKTPQENNSISAAQKNGSKPTVTKAPPVQAISSKPKFLSSLTGRFASSPAWQSPRPDVQDNLRPAVQAELSLDTVKVIHNDLSDADVEVVPIKSRPAAAVIPELPPAKKAWEYLGERLLKATAL